MPTGHGKGSANYEIPKDIAQLSINLAAALNTYLIAQYRIGLSANDVGEKKSEL